MRKAVVVASLLGALMGIGSMARADLSMNGAVGLPLNPTAELPRAGGVEVQGDYYDVGKTTGTVGGFTGDVKFKFSGVHIAGRAGSLPLELEAGYERLRATATVAAGGGTVTGSADESGLSFGAKYLLTGHGNPLGVRVALGAGYSPAMLKNQYAYLVASKNFGGATLGRFPVTGHLGIRYDRLRIKPGDFGGAGIDITSYHVSLYTGVEIPLTRRRELSLIGELQTPRTAVGEYPYSIGLRFAPPRSSLSADIGLQRNGLTGSHGLYAQLNYGFNTLP